MSRTLNVVGIIGETGSGKGNILTHFGYQAYLEGRPVIANYKLEFPFTPMSFTQLVRIATTKKFQPLLNRLSKSVILLSELGVGADSYDFSSLSVQKLTKFFVQIRHIEAFIYYDVQSFDMIAKRLRKQTKGLWLTEDLDKLDTWPGGPVDHSSFGHCNSIYHVEVVDMSFNTISEFVFDGRPTRHLYNTHEQVYGYEDDSEND